MCMCSAIQCSAALCCGVSCRVVSCRVVSAAVCWIDIVVLLVVFLFCREGIKLLHRWAGHVAQANTDTESSMTPRTRGLGPWSFPMRGEERLPACRNYSGRYS